MTTFKEINLHNEKNHYCPLFVFFSFLSSISFSLLKSFPKVNKSFPKSHSFKNTVPNSKDIFLPLPFPSLSNPLPFLISFFTFSPDSFHLLPFPSLLLYFPFPFSLPFFFLFFFLSSSLFENPSQML